MRVAFPSLIVIYLRRYNVYCGGMSVGVGTHFYLQAETESQEAGFQRLQGTFHCVGNESTANVP